MLNNSIEEQLLLYCTRTHVDDFIAKQIKLLIQQKVDWDELIELAIYHQVYPLLHKNLQCIASTFIPPDFVNQLRELNYKNVAASMSLTIKLLELIQLFTSENIQVIPYKGSVLAAAVYQDICLRQSYDIDLLVAPQDVARSGALLISQGYQLDKQYPWEQTFIHFDTGVTIDLHKGVAQSYYPFRLDFEDSIQRCRSVSLLNKMVKSFSAEDLLLVLSVQITKDSYGQTCTLAKVCDVSELVSRYPAIEWELVIDRATLIGCQRLLLLSLLLAHALLDTILPVSIWKLIKQDWVVWQYGKLLSSSFFRPETHRILHFLFKILILIEYPLSASHNRHLLS
jgi:Uncharacterised nucleotidyltransferase